MAETNISSQTKQRTIPLLKVKLQTMEDKEKLGEFHKKKYQRLGWENTPENEMTGP